MPPRQARGLSRPLPRARGTRRARRPCGEHEKGDGENHQEFVMGGGVNALRGNVGGNAGGARGDPPKAFGGVEFMQGVFTAIEHKNLSLLSEVNFLPQVYWSYSSINSKYEYRSHE